LLAQSLCNLHSVFARQPQVENDCIDRFARQDIGQFRSAGDRSDSQVVFVRYSAISACRWIVVELQRAALDGAKN
jgi:hypothetical protein